jgi:4-amino-4-deoxy-L-arabinose transferase-like glycosyltransferase
VTKADNTWRSRGPYILILVGGFALRLYGLGAGSLWYDETVSAFLASESIPDLAAHTARDIHPPGYYLLLHAWTRLAGDGEFALAFLSLAFGVLLIPLAYVLARRLLGRTAALWSALLMAVSPYNLWYSQEARMYTLGAALGLAAAWCALRGLAPDPSPSPSPERRGEPDPSPSPRAASLKRSGRGSPKWRGEPDRAWLAGYALAAAAGLYALYYFGFLLAAFNLYAIGCLLAARRFAGLRDWLLAQAAALVLYLPWLPIAWRQATQPPVPPWRELTPLPAVLLEAWTALSLGQSVEPAQVWPVLILAGALFLLGLLHRTGKAAALAFYTFAPLALMVLASPATPLYHVRYLFTYSPPFYILLGGGLAWLARRARPLAALAAAGLLAGSAFSTYRLHADPRYAPDDFRGAVRFIAERWRPGDAVLVNAGYAYTGWMYYYDGPTAGRVRLSDYAAGHAAGDGPPLLLAGSIDGSPALGWGDPASDFYPTTAAETAAALERATHDYPRLWVLRIYDTVTDPQGLTREWLAAHTTLFEDQVFAGEAFMRVQGYLSPRQPAPPGGPGVPLAGGVTLAGWEVGAADARRAGDPLDVALWWQLEAGSAPARSPHAVSLKLWGGGDSPWLAAQQDEWPLGGRFLTPDWPAGEPVRHPMRLWLPSGLPAGRYSLNVEMYDPATLQPLARADGRPGGIPLGPVVVTSEGAVRSPHP